MDEQVPARHRNRATTACTSCRKGRIRCILSPESRTCVHCRNSDTECIFDDKDGRRGRATAKQVAEVLSQRIEFLEQRLKTNVQSEIERAAMENLSALDMRPVPTEPPPPYEQENFQDAEPNPPSISECGVHPDLDIPKTESAASIVQKLGPSPLRFDMSSGRVRYFGPTTDMSVMTRTSFPKRSSTRKSHWPICLVVPGMSQETNRYLLGLFWTHHNSVVHLVHLDAFYRDQDEGGTDFYSSFLHVAMLATGFRYADKTKPDIKELASSGPTTSVLHQKAKTMAKLEMDRPRGIPTIQGLLLLGGLDFMGGEDESGWIHTGLAFRIVFDIGLHVIPESLRLPELDSQIRHMVLWASLVYDKFWSIYLGRPTTIKTADIAPSCMSFDFNRIISCRSLTHQKRIGTKIYEVLLQLMELASPLCDNRAALSCNHLTDSYFKMAETDQALKQWYLELEPDLRWPSEKQAAMPASFFLLHTQYYATVILLHRGFIQGHDENSHARIDDSSSHLSTLSRSVCLKSAKRIVLLFEQYRSRFNMAQVFETALQHAGTAASSLMNEFVLLDSPTSRAEANTKRDLIPKINSIRATLKAMSANYQSATLMTSVIDQFIQRVQSKNGGIGQFVPSSTAESPLEVNNPHADRRKRLRLENWTDMPEDLEPLEVRPFSSASMPLGESSSSGSVEQGQLYEHPEYWDIGDYDFNSPI